MTEIGNNSNTASERKQEITDAQLETALRGFRASVHAWSEREFSRARSVESLKAARHGWGWRALANPMLSWALAGALAIAVVGTPVKVHHDQQVAAQRQHELQLQQQRLELEAKANAVDDEELMRNVDSDIAQAAPDAMEPLASLMAGSTAQ
jgi:hypothetical protein